MSNTLKTLHDTVNENNNSLMVTALVWVLGTVPWTSCVALKKSLMVWTLVPISKVRIILPLSTFALLTIHVLPKNTTGKNKKKKKSLGSQGSLDIKKYPHTRLAKGEKEEWNIKFFMGRNTDRNWQLDPQKSSC